MLELTDTLDDLKVVRFKYHAEHTTYGEEVLRSRNVAQSRVTVIPGIDLSRFSDQFPS